MSNVYILAYKCNANETTYGILTFTNKKIAREKARYYRDIVHYAFVSLRHDKQCSGGMCSMEGFVEF